MIIPHSTYSAFIVTRFSQIYKNSETKSCSRLFTNTSLPGKQVRHSRPAAFLTSFPGAPQKPSRVFAFLVVLIFIEPLCFFQKKKKKSRKDGARSTYERIMLLRALRCAARPPNHPAGLIALPSLPQGTSDWAFFFSFFF